MIDFTKKVFVRAENIPSDTKIIFVSDLFASEYEGGAELTTEALLEQSPSKVYRIKSTDVSIDFINANSKKYWLFGNFSQIDPRLLPQISKNLKYSIIEYDYKFCRHRSIEKHLHAEGKACDCPQTQHGKVIAAFFMNAQHIFWMSDLQRERYLKEFPELKSSTKHITLSSVFSQKHLDRMESLRKKYENHRTNRWIILGSNSWIKGYEDAKKWCEDNGHEYDVLWNTPYEEALERLAQAEGFVYLPRGGDTCPRMVIEAKLLGIQMHFNECVQNAPESWFTSNMMETTLSYLKGASTRFWSAITRSSELRSVISGYTQTRNCIEQNYPWEESISSLLGFCDEVVIVDGGSSDGTWERLTEMSKLDRRIKPFQFIRDWNDKRFALFNGQQKAEARKRCTGDYLWQVDIDEVVHESDFEKIRQLADHFPNDIDLVALPVIEYWGSEKKIRVDVNPWKWRMSRNNPRITHGVPKDQRRYDDDGTMYSAGSDGDDYIFEDSLERVPFATFYQQDVEAARQAALAGNQDALRSYGQWLDQISANVPGVHHYSWFNLERKIHTYKNFWSKHWASLFNKKQDDTAENNMFFSKPWSKVTDSEIKSLAKKMGEELGGWIFHTRVNFSRPTPWVTLTRGSPVSMSGWMKNSK